MAIVVNNPAETREVREVDRGSDAASWVLALAVIIILALGAYYLLPRLAYRAAAPAAPSTNVQVTLPSNPASTNSGAGAGTGSAAPTGNTGQ